MILNIVKIVSLAIIPVQLVHQAVVVILVMRDIIDNLPVSQVIVYV
jgi:hypothetical protein